MKKTNLYGVAFVEKEQWFVSRCGKKYPVLNGEHEITDRRRLLFGMHENKRVFFNLTKQRKAIITRIGNIRPEMAKSLAEFCKEPKKCWRFSTKSGDPTIDDQTMSILTRQGNTFTTSRD